MSPPVEPDALLSSKMGGVGSVVDIGLVYALIRGIKGHQKDPNSFSPAPSPSLRPLADPRG